MIGLTITEGPLKGTEITPIMGPMVSVRYPSRKTPDGYITPQTVDQRAMSFPWMCLRGDCPEPNFWGDVSALLEHLALHLPKRKK